MNHTDKNKTAIIIGAGPAGLTAAYQLLKETDIKPIVLEEEVFVGGISRTATYHGNRMDIGGHRFFTKNQQVNAIWDTLMPLQGKPAKGDHLSDFKRNYAKNGPDPEKEDIVMLIRNRVSRIFYLRKFFDYPISIKASTFINMGFKNTVIAGIGYVFSSIRKRDEKSLEDFYINRFGRPLYEMFFEDYTEKLWGVHPSNISPSWGAQRVKDLSLLSAIMDMFKKTFIKDYKSNETSLIEQFKYPKRGPGQLWEVMAKEIENMGGEIRYQSKVTGIDILSDSNNISKVTFTNPDDSSEFISGDFFLSTMPIKDLVGAVNASVPSTVCEIASELPYRDFITVGLLLNKLKLKNKTPMQTIGNVIPDCWIYIQERDVKIGRLQVFNNWSPYMVKDVENTVWIGLEYFCTEGDEFWTMDQDAFIDFAINELIHIDVIEKDDILDATCIKVKKAYPAYFGSYDQFDTVREYLDGIDNLYCIGRNGQHRYNNMDHSMLTAIEAVNLIKDGKNDKSIIWNVNTEKEYHESKSN